MRAELGILSSVGSILSYAGNISTAHFCTFICIYLKPTSPVQRCCFLTTVFGGVSEYEYCMIGNFCLQIFNECVTAVGVPLFNDAVRE